MVLIMSVLQLSFAFSVVEIDFTDVQLKIIGENVMVIYNNLTSMKFQENVVVISFVISSLNILHRLWYHIQK